MSTERITFKTHAGTDLTARLDLPEGPHLATALFAHCFTCSRDGHAARRIASRLAGMGIAVLRFDFTGLGDGEGNVAERGITSNVADIETAASYLAGRGMAPSLLIGHSLGGAAVLRVAARIKSARAVVTIGAPFDPAHVARNFGQDLDRIGDEGEAMVTLGGRSLRISREFLDDISAAELGPAIKGLKLALLVLHAPGDNVVGIANARAIFDAAMHPKSFVTLDGADHLINDPDDAEYAAEVIAAWAARYLELSPPAPPPGVPEGVVSVSEAGPDGYLQDVNAGPFHHALADEPKDFGGTNRGMSPYGFVAAGLGACTSMTIRMYARRKGWPLKHVRVDVTHGKVHAQDASAGKNAKIDSFHREIYLEGELDEAQRQRLLEIANKCPVHQTLERSNHVVTVLTDA